MGHYEYMALLVGCLAVTVPLEFLYGFTMWRAPKRLFRAIAPGFVAFVVWDVFAIERGHWSYNPSFMTGVSVGSVPIEELLFFVVIPACGISGYEAVRAGLRGVVPGRNRG